MLSISNIDEFVVFGLEDAPDFTGLSDPVSLFNDLTDSIYTSISFVTNPDLITEGTETMVMTITGQAVDKNNTLLPLTQTPLTLQASVSILDTSSAPVATYNLTRSVATINEGQSVTITLATTNVAAGTSVPWTVTGISAGDLSSGSLTGNFIVGTTDTASFTLSNDATSEGTERLTLTLNGLPVSSFVDVIDTSTSPSSPTFTLTNNVNSPINEGTTVVFTLTTTNISSGTSVPWEIRGIGTFIVTGKQIGRA